MDRTRLSGDYMKKCLFFLVVFGPVSPTVAQDKKATLYPAMAPAEQYRIADAQSR